MNIHERVIALVSGDLREESEAAELLHRLSVSPEKLRLLLDQIQVSRALALHSVASLPTSRTDMALLAAADAFIADEPLPVRAPAERRRTAIAPIITLVGLVALLVGGSGGYLIGTRTAVASHATIASTATSTLSIDEHASSSTSEETPLIQSSAPSSSRAAAPSRLLQAPPAPSVTAVAPRRALAASAAAPRVEAAAEMTEARARLLPEGVIATPTEPHVAANGATIELDRATPQSASARFAEPASPIDAFTATRGDERRWEIAAHAQERLSLPHLPGLRTSPDALIDREITLRYAPDGSHGLRWGLAAGRTRFAMRTLVDAAVDTIYEQAPSVSYLRAGVGGTIADLGAVRLTLDAGVGASRNGPVGALASGVRFEPFDGVALEAGVTTTALVTEFRGDRIVPVNVAAFWGCSVGF